MGKTVPTLMSALLSPATPSSEVISVIVSSDALPELSFCHPPPQLAVYGGINCARLLPLAA